MKLMKSKILVFVILIGLLLIPVSFAAENNLQADISDETSVDSLDLEDISENDGYLSSVIEESNYLSDGSLGSNSSLIEDIESSSKLISDSQSNSNIDSNTISSSSVPDSNFNYNPQFSSDGTRLPDLNSTFVIPTFDLNDSNTLYVNGSFTGTNESGTKANPFKTLDNAFYYLNETVKNIYIAKGSYVTSSNNYIDQNLSIIGEDSSNTILVSNGTSSLFTMYSSNCINFINLSFTRNRTSSYPIIRISGESYINIINSNFRNILTSNKHSKVTGGAISINNAHLNVYNSSFINNTAYVDLETTETGYGGAIYAESSIIRIIDSKFINNSVSSNSNRHEVFGGAISLDLGDMSIFNSQFTGNYLNGTYGTGGAIFTKGAYLSIFNSSLKGNMIKSSYSLGGAISIWASRNVYVVNSTIADNSISGTYTYGSAISNKGTLLGIINSTISNNYAGGIASKNSTVYNMNGIYSINNSKFINNSIKTEKDDVLLAIEDQLIVSDTLNYSSILNELNLSAIPSSYDLRALNLTTAVKNQGSSGACWAFAIYSALESYLLKFENGSYSLSENNMKNMMGPDSENGTEWGDGGNYYMALAYLLRGDGPVNESDDPFSSATESPITGLEKVLDVTDVLLMPLRRGYLDNNQIKLAILKYGAVYTSLYSGVLRQNMNAYSVIPILANHALAIVGWDDNFSRENFPNSPPGDGAFILKNSWGPYSGYSGYYYISYYDASFAASTETVSALAIESVENSSYYGTIYQHDLYGNTYESLGYSCSTAWFANQFTAENNNPLKAFGLYTFGDSTYVVNITVNNKSVYTSSGSIKGAGYHTIELSKLISVKRGDSFRIIVKLTTPSSTFPIAIGTNYSGYSSLARSNFNQSFVSPDGVNWYDLYNYSYNRVMKFYEDSYPYRLNNASVCLKVYTEYMDELELNLSSNVSSFKNNDTIKLNVTVTNRANAARDVFVCLKLDNGLSVEKSSMDLPSNSTNSSFKDNVWYIDKLNGGDSAVLELFILLQKTNATIIQVSANSSTVSLNENVSASLKLYNRMYTRIIYQNMTTQSVFLATEGRVGEYFNVTLQDINGKPLAKKLIQIGFNGHIYNLTSDENGSVRLQINLKEIGNHTFAICFLSDEDYYASFAVARISVIPKVMSLTVPNKSYKASAKTKTLTATLKDNHGNLVKGKKISFVLNGKTYVGTTNSKGIATVKVSLSSKKTYSFTVKFAGNTYYGAVTKTAKLLIK